MVPMKQVTDWLAWVVLLGVVVFVALLIGIVLLFAIVGVAKADTLIGTPASVIDILSMLGGVVTLFFILAILEAFVAERFGEWAAFFMRGVSCVLCIGAAWYLFSGTARADEGPLHKHPPQHEKLHSEFYNDWKMPPSRRQSCCNQKDCYPTPILLDADGKYWARRREDGVWLLVSPLVIEQLQPEGNIIESPDFQSHACIQDPKYGDAVYCATIGGAN